MIINLTHVGINFELIKTNTNAEIMRNLFYINYICKRGSLPKTCIRSQYSTHYNIKFNQPNDVIFRKFHSITIGDGSRYNNLFDFVSDEIIYRCNMW